MAARTANAVWEGSIQEGRGQMSLGSGAFEGNYSFKSRFEEGDNGTNPEELIAAAHAGCFSMALSLVLGEGGNVPESIQTQAKVSLRNVDGNPTITKVALTTRARVPGLDDEGFKKAANAAKDGCVVSRALGGVDEITLDAALDS
jgi:osmotically inducible protein OsmC